MAGKQRRSTDFSSSEYTTTGECFARGRVCIGMLLCFQIFHEVDMSRCSSLWCVLALFFAAGCGGVAVNPETEAKSTDVTAPEDVAKERALAKERRE